MKTSRITALLAIALVFALFWSSCKKEPKDNETQTALDGSFASSEFTAIQKIIEAEAVADSGIYGKVSGTDGWYCLSGTTSVSNVSQTGARLEVNFGSGVTCLDGRVRAGKLIAVFSGKWRNAGATVVITPDDYMVNGNQMEFEKTIVYNGLNNQGNPSWDVTVSNASIQTSTGTITYESVRTTEQTAGYGDLSLSNDEFSITGTASGTARNGRSFTMNTDEPLIVQSDCAHVVAGVLSITPEELQTRSIDYGNGICDNYATLTIGNYTVSITLL